MARREARSEAREEWRRGLSCARGRPASRQSLARWDASHARACLLAHRGNELRFLGELRMGELWLRAEEALCLVEDGLLLLLHHHSALSLQQAYALLLGPVISPAYYAVFNFLHRSNFVSRPHSISNACGMQLLEVYHRRGFCKRLVHDGSLPPLFAAAVFDVREQMPQPARLAEIAASCAPLIVRLACVSNHQVLFLEVEAAADVHLPPQPPSMTSDAPTAVVEIPPPPPSLPPSPPMSPGELEGEVGCIIAGEDSEEEEEESTAQLPTAHELGEALPAAHVLGEAGEASSARGVHSVHPSLPSPPLPWAPITVSSLASVKLFSSLASSKSGPTQRGHAVQHIAHLQQCAEKGLTREVQQHTTRLYGSLHKSLQSVELATEFLRASLAKRAESQQHVQQLAEAIPSLRTETSMGTLWEQAFHPRVDRMHLD
ncbi:MAG: hypothetical protein SGPRY_009529 [Prymnesium sp.]